MQRRAQVVLILVLLVVTGTVYGQAQRGGIDVRVTGPDGAALPGVRVEAISADTLTRRSEFTDENGEVSLLSLDPAQNYVVTADLQGFSTARTEDVIVRAGSQTLLPIQLQIGAVEDEIVVSGAPVAIDFTKPTTGEDITLELTESLPTGRSYQSYLQLVPGVLPSPTGNPASRSGVNYSDIGGTVGTSTDNFYYFEGVNVTDGVTGTFGANLNTEIIQEESVITGGIPAEYAGAPGLVVNVITKSGGNDFTGSLTTFYQDDSLVEESENAEDGEFETIDTAVTIGGPILQDKAWFFASGRLVETDEAVSTPATPTNPSQFLRDVTTESEQGFLKGTWSPTNNDLITGVWLNDPLERSGSTVRTRPNNRDVRREQGGDRWTVGYNRVMGDWIFDLGYHEHTGEVSDFAAVDDPENDVAFPVEANPSIAQSALGGFGIDSIDERGTEGARGSAEYLFETGFGSHQVKGGAEYLEYTNFRDDRFAGDPPAQFLSVTDQFLGEGLTLGEFLDGFDQVTFDPNTPDDYQGLLEALARHPNGAAIFASLDGNGDGTITPDEMRDNIILNSSAGNPDGMINYYRNLEVAGGPQDTKSEGTIFYLQDTWQFGRWSVNAGVRAEEWAHFATTGEEIFTFDTEVAPRLGVVYDLFGSGKHRLSGYYGRYYDPIRNNMTNFAGTLTGQRTEEQIFVNGEWLTYRFRGGATNRDAVFVPTTQTPWTDEYLLGYKGELQEATTLEVNLVHRETRDILEDFFLQLYADPNVYPGPVDHPDSLFLGPQYFGFDSLADLPENVNFFIGTMPESFRRYQGAEITLRKRLTNNWQGLVSYTFSDAEGNSNSDSNADFAGDVIFLDPRAPNVIGTQPGSIEHLAKASISYHWNNGIQLGAFYSWNSGTVANRTFSASGRNLPNRVPVPFDFAGITNTRWVEPGAVGGFENPSNSLLDLRFGYTTDLFGRFGAAFFVDVFNVFDDQDAIRVQDLVAGGGGLDFGEGLIFNEPRRFSVGVRLSM